MLRFKGAAKPKKPVPVWQPRVTTPTSTTRLPQIIHSKKLDALNTDAICQQFSKLKIHSPKKNLLVAYQQSRAFSTQGKAPLQESFSIGKKFPNFAVLDNQGNVFNLNDIIKRSLLFAANTLVVFQPGLVMTSLPKLHMGPSACTLQIHDYAELNHQFDRLGYNVVVLIADENQFDLIDDPLLPIYALPPSSIKKIAALGRPCFEFNKNRYPLQFTCVVDRNLKLSELYEFKAPQDVFLSLIWQNWQPSFKL